MKNWTQILLRFDTIIFRLKTRLADEKHGVLVFFWSLLIILIMLAQGIVALPLYIFLTPSKLKKQGASEKEIKVFVLKRQVTLAAFALFVLIFVVKIFFAGAFVAFFFPKEKASAANVSWAFQNPGEYVYDAAKIQIVDGIALFKATNPETTPSPTGADVSPTATLVETVISQAPATDPVSEPTVAVTEVPAPTAAPLPVIEVATPIPEPVVQTVTQAPVESAPAPVVEESAPAPAAPQPEEQSAPAAPPPAEAPPPVEAPVLGAETSCVATIQPVSSLTVSNLDHWNSFSESAVTNGGSITYQLSDNNGQSWQYWNGVAWTTGDGWNSAGEISAHMILFPAKGTVLFRAKMQSDCTKDMQLLGISVDYDTKVDALPTIVPTEIPVPTAVPTVPLQTNLPELTSIPTETVAVPTIIPTILPTLQLEPTALPLPTPTPAAGIEEIVDELLNNLEEFFTGTSAAVPTPELPTPTPSIEVTTPIATGSSTLLQTDVTINQPVQLFAPLTVEANVASVGGTITIPGSQGYNVPQHFSLSGAFSLSALGTNTTIVAKAGSYSFGTSADGKKLVLQLTSTEGVTETIDASLPSLTGEQVNVAIATYDGIAVRLYLNGTLIGTKELQMTVAQTETTVSIGEGDLVAAQVNPFVLYDTVLTPEEIALRYLQVNNLSAQLVITGVEQISGGNVQITYKLIDPNNHILALDVYEYSTTGAFAGEQHVMTQDFDSSLHDGVYDLDSSLAGTTHTFIWKAGQDIGNLDNTTVYVKLRPFDGILAGQGSIASLPVTTKPQTATITSATQLPDGNVQLQYALVGTDPHATVALEVSSDNGETWQPATTVSGDVGSVDTGVDKTIVWDAERDFEGRELANVQLRLKVTDSLGNSGYSTVSEALSLDTQAPFGMSAFHAVATTQTTATLAWSPVSSETNFKIYAIWYGTNQQDVANETGSAQVWTNTNDSGLALQGTSATIIPNLLPNTTYFAKLVATDTRDHVSSLPVIQFVTSTTQTEITTPILNQPQSPTTETTIILSGIADAQAVLGLYIDGTLTKEDWVTAQANGTFSGSVAVPDGTHTITVIATVDGQVSPQSNTVVVTINPAITQTEVVPSLIPTVIAPTEIPIPSPTPTPASLLDQVVETIEDVIGGLLGTPTPEPTLIPEVVPTILPTMVPSIATLSETPEPSLPVTLPTSVSELLTPTPVQETQTEVLPTATNQTSTTETTSTTNTIINRLFGTQAGPLPLRTVSQAQGNDLSNPASLANQLNRSIESKIIPAPAVTKINQPAARDVITLSGRGIPNSEVVLYLFSQQAVIYRVPVKEDSTWELSHDQSYVDLQPGQHSVYAVTLNSGSNVKSKPSLVKSFTVQKDWRVILSKLIDIPTTIMTIVIVAIGIVWFKMRKNKKRR